MGVGLQEEIQGWRLFFKQRKQRKTRERRRQQDRQQGDIAVEKIKEIEKKAKGGRQAKQMRAKQKKELQQPEKRNEGEFSGYRCFDSLFTFIFHLAHFFFQPFILNWLFDLCMDYSGLLIIYCVYIICGLVFSIAYVILFEKQA